MGWLGRAFQIGGVKEMWFLDFASYESIFARDASFGTVILIFLAGCKLHMLAVWAGSWCPQRYKYG